ncbi:hypothetical protein BU15DRAFT_88407 [Melanogaster broomeanus]|nr:hypothetical protein BU15DRAFT_88407 [Melanogaster broomeanus]
MFKAPFPPYDPLDTSGYDTVVKRWPIIITNLIDHVHRLIHDMTMESQRLTTSGQGESDRVKELQDKVTEGKAVITKASRLKYRMARDQELEQILQDGDIYVDAYNAELAELATTKQNTWFTAPWLYAEYRLFRSYFNETKQWRNFDPFFEQKEEMFKNSGAAIYKIATTMHELEVEKHKLKSDPDKLMDLSLLTHLAPSDIEHLQTVGKDAQQARKAFILKDDQEATLAGQGGRCDFVLDNGTYSPTLVFADFLVTYTPYFSKVVFHPKLFPWFVSDDPPASHESAAHLEQMVKRWQSYLEQGTFVLMAKFWTGPWPYWNMKERASQLWEWLHVSDLVIFKVSPLVGSFPLLSLRTNKADVAVGIPEEVAGELDRRGEKWRVSGK